MSKLKHNKKRNTGILYETLIRELTRASARSDKKRSDLVLGILKEFFNRSTVLGQELELYKTLNEKNGYQKEMAEKILTETKKRHSSLDKKRLFKEQSNVIKQINYKLGSTMFENYVPNFKNYATIYQVLNGAPNVQQQVRLEESIISEMAATPVDKESKYKAIDNLSYKTFLNKFNEKYSDKLLREQKELLSLYATSFKGSDLELKIFLNEEVSRLKDSVSKLQIEQKNEILEVLESFAKKKIDKTILDKVLKVQQLVSEITKHGN